MRFETRAEAIRAGWRFPGPRDIDVSGEAWYGYEYESPDGAHTVTVQIHEPSSIGLEYSFVPAFPPKEDPDG